MDCLYSVPTQMLVHFMKMENMMYNIYDYPELFKEMMDRIAEDTLAYYRMLEEKHLILPTVSGQALGQGTWCYNHELPGEEEAKKAQEVYIGFTRLRYPQHIRGIAASRPQRDTRL